MCSGGAANSDGRYVVSATSGITGRRCIIVNDRRKWASIIASYARANEWAGIRAGLTHRVSMAVVSSTTTWHQSARVAATVQRPLVCSERIGAATPLPRIVARLNELQPQVLVGCASAIRALAEEQLDGRLHIAPRAVNSASEVLTDQARTLAENAWHVRPFDVYAATETGRIAAECAHHHGRHLFEDLVIPEVVDDRYRPVQPGETGERLLVTVLFSRILPLIRYELSDRVRMSTQRCPCALPFRLVTAIEGRTSDILVLPNGSGGSTRIHPVLFHRVLDLVDARAWQVRQRATGLGVLVAYPDQRFDAHAIERSLVAGLTDADASAASVRVSLVDEIPAGPAGKRPLVVAETQSNS